MRNLFRNAAPAVVKRLHDTDWRWKVAVLTILVVLANYLPPFMVRSSYIGKSLDPFDPVNVAWISAHIPLVTIPVLILWLWFPAEYERFVAKINGVARTRQPRRDIMAWWEWLVGLTIVAALTRPFLDGVAADAAVEWFDFVRWGWILALILAGGLSVLAAVALIRVTRFVLWFVKVAKEGLQVNPIDPDGCGGLGFVGVTFGKLTLIAVVLGLWVFYAAIFTYYYANQGQPTNSVAYQQIFLLEGV